MQIRRFEEVSGFSIHRYPHSGWLKAPNLIFRWRNWGLRARNAFFFSFVSWEKSAAIRISYLVGMDHVPLQLPTAGGPVWGVEKRQLCSGASQQFVKGAKSMGSLEFQSGGKSPYLLTEDHGSCFVPEVGCGCCSHQVWVGSRARASSHGSLWRAIRIQLRFKRGPPREQPPSSQRSLGAGSTLNLGIAAGVGDACGSHLVRPHHMPDGEQTKSIEPAAASYAAGRVLRCLFRAPQWGPLGSWVCFLESREGEGRVGAPPKSNQFHPLSQGHTGPQSSVSGSHHSRG
ncbi:hypothetical protein NDU88_012162 [Pleurodeles waltl]|uniref:Uncharacterized protein n=1 Tax=Pleurodeles waltl TaxID=8319 RepID=A0AAV7R3V0_PLEWA|nr:hypothetical protein NDU88_012162 [Pleurodeles waltl]